MTLSEIKKIWIEDDAIHIESKDGRHAKECFCNYRRLKNATDDQRQKYQINEYGLYWPELDEDLSFAGFFKNRDAENEVAKMIKGNPIINASALARRLDIPQPLFAAYVSGDKKPSIERIKLIKNEIKKIGRELSSI